MTNLISDAFIQAKELVMKAMGELVADGTFPAEPVPAFNTEIPADSKNGDVSTNAAMVCARPFRNNPRKIAEASDFKDWNNPENLQKREIIEMQMM